jgi:hypothetical protein
MQIGGQTISTKAALLVIGLIAGLLVGYVTRPESAEIRIGPLSIEVTGKNVGRHSDGELTSSQVQHIALFTIIGGLIGLGLGFVAGGRRIG